MGIFPLAWSLASIQPTRVAMNSMHVRGGGCVVPSPQCKERLSFSEGKDSDDNQLSVCFPSAVICQGFAWAVFPYSKGENASPVQLKHRTQGSREPNRAILWEAKTSWKKIPLSLDYLQLARSFGEFLCLIFIDYILLKLDLLV